MKATLQLGMVVVSLELVHKLTVVCPKYTLHTEIGTQKKEIVFRYVMLPAVVDYQLQLTPCCIRLPAEHNRTLLDALDCALTRLTLALKWCSRLQTSKCTRLYAVTRIHAPSYG